MASLAVVDLLAEHDIQAKIKWPNDVYVGDEKICGILIENAVCGTLISHSIVGIGLNVNQRNFDVSLPNPTSMLLSINDGTENDAMEFNLAELLDEYMDILSGYIDRFCHITGGYNRLNQLYLAQMWRRNERAEFIDNSISPSAAFTGTIRGVSGIGHLIIETKEGELREFAFKDISYII
jgi:BirA family biotin operon repressor/biotin-[acetyl-CoA-carboxylase] ligase